MEEWGKCGVIDLGLEDGELLQGMVTFNNKLYVFTQRRTFVVKKKSWLRMWWERLWRE
jgi:hypothetical protein